jgi:hypothetical protein
MKDERLAVTTGEKASVDATAVAQTNRNAFIDTLILVSSPKNQRRRET